MVLYPSVRRFPYVTSSIQVDWIVRSRDVERGRWAGATADPLSRACGGVPVRRPGHGDQGAVR